ncbi:MAG: hypothetical protein K0S93_2160 [Nitrososphaeraceae archaeon]|jgi:hypothetical protein|nr:hypothetical protein [Nitrososphaeraceae archaeon]
MFGFTNLKSREDKDLILLIDDAIIFYFNIWISKIDI